VHRDVYGERDGEVHGPWWAVKHLLFMILSVMVRNGMCAAPVIREGRHCCAPPRFRSSQCLISFEHTPSRQERWFSLHPCKCDAADCSRTMLHRANSSPVVSPHHRHTLALRRVLRHPSGGDGLGLPTLWHRCYHSCIACHSRARSDNAADFGDPPEDTASNEWGRGDALAIAPERGRRDAGDRDGMV